MNVNNCYKIAREGICCSSAKEHTCEGGCAAAVCLFWILDAQVSLGTSVACPPPSLALLMSIMKQDLNKFGELGGITLVFHGQ